MNMTEKLRYGKGRRIPVILVMIALLFNAECICGGRNDQP